MAKKYLLVLLILLSLLHYPSHETGAQTLSYVQLLNGVNLISSDPSGLVIEVLAPNYEIIGKHSRGAGFEKIRAPGFENSLAAGELHLPVKGVLLGIPPEVQFEIEILEDQLVEIPGRINLMRNSRPAQLVGDLQPGEMSSPQPSEISDRGLYPNSPLRVGGDGWLRDQRIVRLEIYPFQYSDTGATLLWHKRMLVKLNFSPDPPASLTHRSDNPISEESRTDDGFDKLLQGVLLNYDQARAWRGLPSLRPGNASLSAGLEQSASEPRYKIAIDQDGIYKITYEDLKAAGLDVDSVDPRHFHMTSQGQDVAIFVYGQADGIFEAGDYIQFYGRKFFGDVLAQRYALESSNWMTYTHQLANGKYGLWHPDFNATMMEKYTDENVYWLRVGDTNGLRMETVPNETDETTPVQPYYNEKVHAEQSHEWYTHNFSGEDTWFWDRIQVTRDVNNISAMVSETEVYSVTLSDLASVPINAAFRAEIVSRYNGSAQPDHHTSFSLNDELSPIADFTWEGISRYHLDLEIPQDKLIDGRNDLKFSVILDQDSDQFFDDIYFDWFEIDYARLFRAIDDQLVFSIDEGGTLWRYEIEGFSSDDVQVFDITDGFKPKLVTSDLISGTVIFGGSQEEKADYYVVGSNVIRKPLEIKAYTPVDLRSPDNGFDYIFIAHNDFLDATQALADYRAAQGLSVTVVDIEDVYNQFNDGILNPIAIKNFLAYTIYNWSKPPTYVLLVGDGHWNPKGYQSNLASVDYSSSQPVYIPPNLSWVDPWQGEVDSVNLLATVVGSDPLPDVHIGRLPVNSVEELNMVIDKIIFYESAPFDPWQYRVMFVADDNDALAGDFSSLAEGIVNDYIPSGFRTERLYLDDYLDSAKFQELINQDIKLGLNDPGVSLLNYIGHASVDQWAHKIFTSSDIPELSNGGHLPVLLSMDCLDGYWLHPNTQGLVEEMLRAENKGIIGAFSPTGLGVATGHDALQRGFYQAVFKDNMKELGPATLAGKLALYTTGVNQDLLHTFTIFGDPALNMKIPAPAVYLPITLRSTP